MGVDKRYSRKRGIAFAAEIPQRKNEKVIIRHYWHGGIFGPLLQDIFWGSTRALPELNITETARERGVATVEIIGAVRHSLPGRFYRAEIISKQIPDSVPLDTCLRKCSSRIEKREIIGEVARAIRKLHQAGIYHFDLNVRNILINHSPNQKPRVYIIDFDRAEIKSHLSIREKLNNLSRLNRSCDKLKVPLPQKDKLRFFDIYSGQDKTFFHKYVRKCGQYSPLHRLSWRVESVTKEKG